jgi:hypothetical protein
MNLALLLPAALAALAAVLLPLLIHLARRSEQRPTVFAALRWLRQKPKPRHRIRFDEWPLLLVRLLLVALLAVLLARPVLYGAASPDPWVAVAPGIDPAQARAIDAPADARWHWLAPGFPALDAPPREAVAYAARAPLTSLLRELDAALPTGVALTVVVPDELRGVDGERPRLSRAVDWRPLPVRLPDAVAPRPSPPPALSVRFAPDREPALRYLRAAHVAWHDARPPTGNDAIDIAQIAQPLPSPSRSLVWLAGGPLPTAVRDWIRGGGTALLDARATLADAAPRTALWRDDDGAVLVEGAAYGRGRVLRLTRPLSPAQMPALLDASFPHRLRALFEPAPAPPSRVRAADHAPLTGGPTFPLAPQTLAPWLLALIALLFLVERWMATGARGRAAP